MRTLALLELTKARIDKQMQSCESISLKGVIKRLDTADFRVGQEYRIGHAIIRTEMAPNQTTNFAGYAGKTRHIGKDFHANLWNLTEW